MNNTDQLLKEIEDSMRPPCFGYYHSDEQEECEENCAFTNACRYHQVVEVLSTEAYAMEFEDVLRQERQAMTTDDIVSEGGDPINGKSFVFTGNIKVMEKGRELNRMELSEKIRERGGLTPTRLTKSNPPDYLVRASSTEEAGVTTKKLEDAEKLNVKLLSEQDFMTMYHYDPDQVDGEEELDKMMGKVDSNDNQSPN